MCIRDSYYAGLDMQVFYQMLVDHFRNLVLTKVVAGAEGITEMTQEDWSKLQEQTGKVSRETLQRLLEILMAEEETMRRTQSPRLVLEMALTRMAHLAPLIPIDEILARMASLERSLMSGAVATVENSKVQLRPVTEIKGPGDSGVPMPIAAVREQAVTGYGAGEKARAANAKGDQSWEGFKAFVKQSNPPLWSKLDPGQMLSRENDRLTVCFPKTYVFFEDIEKHQKEAIGELARNYFHRPGLEIKIEAQHVDPVGNNGKMANGNAKAQLINDIRQEALKHPLVQKVMDIFENAEIRDVIPRQSVTEGEVE